MTQIPNLSDKLSSINIEKSKKELKEAEDAYQKQINITKSQVEKSLWLTNANHKNFRFDPRNQRFYLADSVGDNMSLNTYVNVNFNRSSDTNMATSFQSLEFHADRFIQDVKSGNQNLIICAEALEAFAELFRAFEDKRFVNAFIESMNEFWGFTLSVERKANERSKIVYETTLLERSCNYYHKVFQEADINSLEELKEFLDSLNNKQEVIYHMKEMGITEYPKNKKEAIDIILNYICQNDVEP